MEDELALDAEAMGEDDRAADRAAQKCKALGRRQSRHVFAANSLCDVKHAALNVRRNRAVKTKIKFVIRLLTRAADAANELARTIAFQERTDFVRKITVADHAKTTLLVCAAAGA